MADKSTTLIGLGVSVDKPNQPSFSYPLDWSNDWISSVPKNQGIQERKEAQDDQKDFHQQPVHQTELPDSKDLGYTPLISNGKQRRRANVQDLENEYLGLRRQSIGLSKHKPKFHENSTKTGRIYNKSYSVNNLSPSFLAGNGLGDGDEVGFKDDEVKGLLSGYKLSQTTNQNHKQSHQKDENEDKSPNQQENEKTKPIVDQPESLDPKSMDLKQQYVNDSTFYSSISNTTNSTPTNSTSTSTNTNKTYSTCTTSPKIPTTSFSSFSLKMFADSMDMTSDNSVLIINGNKSSTQVNNSEPSTELTTTPLDESDKSNFGEGNSSLSASFSEDDDDEGSFSDDDDNSFAASFSDDDDDDNASFSESFVSSSSSSLDDSELETDLNSNTINSDDITNNSAKSDVKDGKKKKRTKRKGGSRRRSRSGSDASTVSTLRHFSIINISPKIEQQAEFTEKSIGEQIASANGNLNGSGENIVGNSRPVGTRPSIDELGAREVSKPQRSKTEIGSTPATSSNDPKFSKLMYTKTFTPSSTTGTTFTAPPLPPTKSKSRFGHKHAKSSPFANFFVSGSFKNSSKSDLSNNYGNGNKNGSFYNLANKNNSKPDLSKKGNVYGKDSTDASNVVYLASRSTDRLPLSGKYGSTDKLGTFGPNDKLSKPEVPQQMDKIEKVDKIDKTDKTEKAEKSKGIARAARKHFRLGKSKSLDASKYLTLDSISNHRGLENVPNIPNIPEHYNIPELASSTNTSTAPSTASNPYSTSKSPIMPHVPDMQGKPNASNLSSLPASPALPTGFPTQAINYTPNTINTTDPNNSNTTTQTTVTTSPNLSSPTYLSSPSLPLTSHVTLSPTLSVFSTADYSKINNLANNNGAILSYKKDSTPVSRNSSKSSPKLGDKDGGSGYNNSDGSKNGKWSERWSAARSSSGSSSSKVNKFSISAPIELVDCEEHFTSQANSPVSVDIPGAPVTGPMSPDSPIVPGSPFVGHQNSHTGSHQASHPASPLVGYHGTHQGSPLVSHQGSPLIGNQTINERKSADWSLKHSEEVTKDHNTSNKCITEKDRAGDKKLDKRPKSSDLLHSQIVKRRGSRHSVISSISNSSFLKPFKRSTASRKLVTPSGHDGEHRNDDFKHQGNGAGVSNSSCVSLDSESQHSVVSGYSHMAINSSIHAHSGHPHPIKTHATLPYLQTSSNYPTSSTVPTTPTTHSPSIPSSSSLNSLQTASSKKSFADMRKSILGFGPMLFSHDHGHGGNRNRSTEQLNERPHVNLNERPHSSLNNRERSRDRLASRLNERLIDRERSCERLMEISNEGLQKGQSKDSDKSSEKRKEEKDGQKSQKEKKEGDGNDYYNDKADNKQAQQAQQFKYPTSHPSRENLHSTNPLVQSTSSTTAYTTNSSLSSNSVSSTSLSSVNASGSNSASANGSGSAARRTHTNPALTTRKSFLGFSSFSFPS